MLTGASLLPVDDSDDDAEVDDGARTILPDDDDATMVAAGAVAAVGVSSVLATILVCDRSLKSLAFDDALTIIVVDDVMVDVTTLLLVLAFVYDGVNASVAARLILDDVWRGIVVVL